MAGPAQDLLSRGEAGDIDAQIALGRAYEAENNVRLARGWFSRAAKAGSTEAMRALAVNLLSRQPIVERDGVGMIQMAAHRGDAQAAYICGLLAAQDRNLQNRWEIALACLGDATERGLPGAGKELSLITGRDGAHTASTAFDIGAFTSALPLEEISASPRLSILRRCLRADMCDWLMAQCRPRLERAPVYDPVTGGSRIEGARSNSQVTMDVLNSNFVVMLLRERIAASVGLPTTSLEVTSILRYKVGEEFTPHFDFFDSDTVGYSREVAERGQRIATVLVYLNEDFEGGETEFPKINLSHRGRKGDALLFWNVDASGRPDPATFHAGRPPTRGEKWVVSQWLRDRSGSAD